MTFEGPGDDAPMDIKELARVLDLSVGTVSRSLNNRAGVSPQTRQRVLAAAKEHRYSPNSAARQLKARPTLLLGLFFAPYYGPNREINPNALHFIEVIRRTLVSQGMDMKVLYYRDDADLRAQALEVDVGLFYGHFPDASFRVVHELGIPAVLFDKVSSHPDQVCVLADTKQSCNMAVQYLAALGHERIGMVTGPASELYFHAYAEAFPLALAEFNLPIRHDWIFELPGERCNQEGSAAALLPILRAKDRPTAIVFASDWLALGGRQAARPVHSRRAQLDRPRQPPHHRRARSAAHHFRPPPRPHRADHLPARRPSRLPPPPARRLPREPHALPPARFHQARLLPLPAPRAENGLRPAPQQLPATGFLPPKPQSFAPLIRPCSPLAPVSFGFFAPRPACWPRLV